MIDRSTIEQILYSVIDTINEDLLDDEKVTKSTDTILFGKDAKLDSLIFVNLIVGTEQRIAERFGQEITLAYEEETYGENPLITVATLVDIIAHQLEQIGNE